MAGGMVLTYRQSQSSDQREEEDLRSSEVPLVEHARRNKIFKSKELGRTRIFQWRGLEDEGDPRWRWISLLELA